MSRFKGTSLVAAHWVALPLLSLVAVVIPKHTAAAASPVLSGAASKTGQTPLTLRFAALDRVSGEDPDLPIELLGRYHGETLKVVYQVCVRSDGSVMLVNWRSGITDVEVDAIFLRTLRTWRYPAQPANTMTCLLEIFELSQ